jgi:hypothetical protein
MIDLSEAAIIVLTFVSIFALVMGAVILLLV